MGITRRDFLKASSAVAAAFGLKGPAALAAAAPSSPSVVWLQAQGCSGCSVSLLNSIYYATVDGLLLNTLSLDYHPTLMAAAGADAVTAAKNAVGKKGYILVVEGAIPTANGGQYCYLWPRLTALKGVQSYAGNAGFVLAVGTCSAYGGMPGGSPNPTGVRSLGTILGTSRVINIPGCPSHPDWIVGTIAHLLKYRSAPPLDSLRRPQSFFGKTVHSQCPYREDDDDGCLEDLGCKGKKTYADCPSRKWNAGAAGTAGVNWCVLAGSPCHGCTEPGFPDGMSPFYSHESGGGEGGDDDD
jgi:hydrogenase small subunit